MRFARALTCVLSILAASCAHVSSGSVSRSSLIGVWYGNAIAVDDGAPGDNINVRNGDGTFITYFRLCGENGGVSDVIVETGTWTFADGIDSTETLSVNGQLVVALDDYYRESYKVVAESNRKLRLTSLKAYGSNTHPVFEQVRVDDHAFHLPVEPCGGNTRTAAR